MVYGWGWIDDDVVRGIHPQEGISGLTCTPIAFPYFI